MPELQVSQLHWHHLLREISDDNAIMKRMLWSVEFIAAAAPDAISASSTESCAIAARIVPRAINPFFTTCQADHPCAKVVS